MKKTGSIPRIILLSLFLSVVTIHVAAQKVTLSYRNVAFEKVLNSIKQQTGLSLVFSEQLVDVTRKVTINVSSIEVQDALTQLLIGTNVGFEIKNNKLYLIEKKEERTEPKNNQKKVTGLVTDQKGEPIIGATVIIKGKTNGTITDINGKFNLDVQGDAILKISYIGFQTKEVVVNNQKELKILLSEDSKALNEVVVVGYGTQKKVNVVGSIATVSADKLALAPVASTSNALAGRLPGLITKQESGLPGADGSSLSIRGFGTPLVIVDGVESSFNNIDANEIESISVLKDAAAAVYGARAGNGVVLVTTKRGNEGKPTIKLQTSNTFQQATNLPHMASSGQMAELWRESQLNSGLAEAQLRFTEEEVQKFYAGTDSDYPNTDWLSLISRNWAPQSEYNLSVRGGSEKIKYYGFLGYINQQSMFKSGGNYDRYNLRSNIDAKILDNLSLQLDLSSILENKNYTSRSNEKDNSVWQEYWNSEPFWNSTLPDPTKIPYAGAGGSIGVNFMTNSNLCGYNRTYSQNMKGSIALKYDFKGIKGLSAKAFANYNQDYVFQKTFGWLSDSWSYNYSSDTYIQKTSATQPILNHNDSKSRTLTGQLSLNYETKIGTDHRISAMALYELIDYYSDWIQAKRIGYTTNSIDYLFAGGLANQIANGSASEMGRSSLINRINYSYKEKYLLEGTLRIDESAKFDKEHRRGYFPGISTGWRISEEDFIKHNATNVDNLKLRLSYSETGNDAVANFAYLSGYNYNSNDTPVSGQPDDPSGRYLFGNATAIGLISTGIANPFLTWENMTNYNAGFDFSFFNRKLYGTFDVFYRNREGIPGQRVNSLPDTFGATLPIENLNSMNTRGFEALLGTEGKSGDFQWDISVNISWSRSKWGHYDEPEYDDPDEIRLFKKSGQWVDRSFGYLSDGVFTSQDEIDNLDFVYSTGNGNSALAPGDVKYKEYVKDGILDWRDQVEIGQGTTPHWMGGANFSLRYKNFDLSALFQGAFGFYNNIKLRWGSNFTTLIYNERWTPDNNRSNVLIARLGGANSNSYYSDFNYKKADYLRLKTMSIGYNLPKSLLKNLKIESLRISATGTNIFTFSELIKYDIDPEAPNGYSGYYYPQMQTISFGLSLTI